MQQRLKTVLLRSKKRPTKKPSHAKSSNAIIALAARAETNYPDDRAWDVARKLASSALGVLGGDSEGARAGLLAAIRDPRLGRAANPIGLLIRGILGDKNGRDRYLWKASTIPAPVDAAVAAVTTRYETSTQLPPGLHDALLDAIRSG